MTSKERAMLKKSANGIDAIYQVGKTGINRQFIKGVGEALWARELIKISVHQSSDIQPREAAEEISKRLDCETVQVVGRKIVLYKRRDDINRYGV